MGVENMIAFLLMCLGICVAEPLAWETPGQGIDTGGLSRTSFPEGFVFGTASSAYQVEGAANSEGRGPSIWDPFVLTPGKIADNSTADVTVDEYHRYKEDVELMVKMNMDAYRFSISWSRIFPNGTGPVNDKGVQYYNNLIDYLLERGIVPYANLYHYDLPLGLEQAYEGWLSSKIVEEYANFAEFCFRTFGDRVKNWMTFNEPRVVAALGYDNGIFAPARCSSPFGNCSAGNSATEPYIVAHNLLLSHAAAVKIYREKYQAKQKGKIGILLDFVWFEPLTNSVFPQYFSDDGTMDATIMEEGGSVKDKEDQDQEEDDEFVPDVVGKLKGSQLPAFSGAYSLSHVREVFESEMDQENGSDRDGASTIFEEVESISVGELMKSPVFSEDGTDNLYCIDLGQSPLSLENSGKLGSPRLPYWFSSKKHLNKIRTPEHTIHEDEQNCSALEKDQVISFDAALLSVSQLDSTKEPTCSQSLVKTPENLQTGRRKPYQTSEMNGNGNGTTYSSKEDTHLEKYLAEQRSSTAYSMAGSSKLNPSENGSLVDYKAKESAIRRETEGEFRLLGRREADRFSGRHLCVGENGRISSMARKVSFSSEIDREGNACILPSGGESGSTFCKEEDITSDAEITQHQEWARREPEISCMHLDHVDMMGLNKTTLRLRYLINWLVTSLLQLRFPVDNGRIPLVHIYGPKIKYERGAALAFNLYDVSGTLINPELVQKLAEKNDISLGLGFLSHLRFSENYTDLKDASYSSNDSLCKPIVNGRYDSKNVFVRVEVVTASLGFLSNFEDVYRLWAFVAKFLNADFIKGDVCQMNSQAV